MFSHSFLLGSSRSELQFIDDLINLCKRHQLGCGEPRDLDHLAADLLFNDDFRIDLFTLCTAISHMTEVEPTPEQLLILVARAFGGPALSIRDVNADIPHSASSAFLNGYEAWLKPEPEIAPASSWIQDQPQDRPTDRSADRPRPPSRPTLYFAAASLSEADFPQTQEEPASTQPTTETPPHIPPNTTLESLTLNELRTYLKDIESRVSRIEPKREPVAPQPYFPPEYFERLEALDHKTQRARPQAIAPVSTPDTEAAPQPTVSVTYPLPASTTRPIVPIIETDSTPAIPYAPAIVPYQTAVAALSPVRREIHHAPDDIVRLRQLRFVNVLLIVFLAVASCLTVFFAYRYLTGHPPSFADTISRFPHPLDEQSPDTTAPNHASPLPPATLFIPNPVYNTGGSHTTHSSRTPGKSISTSPVTLFPQPEPSISDAYPKPNPDRNPDQINDRSAPPATFASIAPSPSSPADTSAPPPSAVVSVPSTMMMSYAIAAPKPVYPSFRHIGTDSTVDVETTISKDGRVIGVRALDGTLDVRAAAVEAVLGWRFRPFLVDGKPVGVVTTFKFVFKGN